MGEIKFIIQDSKFNDVSLSFGINPDMASCGVQLLCYVRLAYNYNGTSESYLKRATRHYYQRLSDLLEGDNIPYKATINANGTSQTSPNVREIVSESEAEQLRKKEIEYLAMRLSERAKTLQTTRGYRPKTVTIATDRVGYIGAGTNSTIQFCKEQGFSVGPATKNNGSGGDIAILYKSKNPFKKKAPEGFANT